jgi:hypothetical protein
VEVAHGFWGIFQKRETVFFACAIAFFMLFGEGKTIRIAGVK